MVVSHGYVKSNDNLQDPLMTKDYVIITAIK